MKHFFNDILNLRTNADFEKTRALISDGITLRGYNLWILVCSTILASIGLDTNSAAVIIGAMLISPLMSPILGVGLALAVHDRQLFLRSLRNLLIAIGISLLVSILYFLLSPLGKSTPELQARTFPTLLDVLIALFGGIAGIVSISRHDQTTAIPGVAIATALMPPLCTAGFGIGTGNWNYFFGAFYLFFINAVFISFATYFISRYLHFPEKKFADTKKAKQYRRWFLVLSIIALTPSTYFLYGVYKDEVAKKNIEKLVLTPIRKQGNEILKWELVKRDTVKLIKVYHSGEKLSDSLKNYIDSSLRKEKMSKYHLVSMRVNLTKEEVNELSEESSKRMFEQMQEHEFLGNNNTADTLAFEQISKEIKTAFPFVDTCYSGWVLLPGARSGTDTIPIVFYKTLKRERKTDIKRLYNFLLLRLHKDSAVLIKK